MCVYSDKMKCSPDTVIANTTATNLNVEESTDDGFDQTAGDSGHTATVVTKQRQLVNLALCQRKHT